MDTLGAIPPLLAIVSIIVIAIVVAGSHRGQGAQREPWRDGD